MGELLVIIDQPDKHSPGPSVVRIHNNAGLCFTSFEHPDPRTRALDPLAVRLAICAVCPAPDCRASAGVRGNELPTTTSNVMAGCLGYRDSLQPGICGHPSVEVE